ncbi:hypothetical protein CcaverHIS002_0312020 [Cutaneotrichosporon cavernicola]|uniref:Uncharacterized protein n=1 Tax=Cutaneotrichosporon cavernicola TaxID=279322 RepID=A0AA48L377_9TREE|nr:uncharacterized protein CcaverHIS019_0311880 [Cutaneotrichosporon cavernicola]BEI83334.1 hypothetical protein CcaverHIS002_0312020 [Cutaneotrichosporon cavernicola]BEI91118.1 hypothetical protein CcaverHIS019_0311880 [Cutaneotrichosporon cavernicola]BEI98895.1 hypothetical protein CcaverHIS631_0311940 [Cutaneotrichosporon cavernicola]BEJ06668.1 hypothetical protein CcaverHIS641_0311900 [Cutaneotrichosporon cavernicola]
MYDSSWFSLKTPPTIDDDTLILPSALSRSITTRTSMTPMTSMATHRPSTSSSNRRRSRSPALSRLRRRGVLIALVIALPILAFLIMEERHSQRVALASWAAELAARENAAYPDPQGRVDLAAWRNRIASRQNLELERRVVGDEQEEWPAWWGNADEVGPSPFDHVPSPLDGKRRVLFLTAYDDYLQRMNTHTYEIVDAALRHPNVIVDVWGPGWAGYDWDVPLSVNVKRRANRIAQLEASRTEHTAAAARARQAAARERWASERNDWFRKSAHPQPQATDVSNEESDFEPWNTPEWIERVDECNDAVRYDIVWTISDIYKANDMPHVDALDCGALLVQQLGDCHEHRCLKEWYPQANNITVTKYGFELPELFNLANVRKVYPSFEMGLFGHSPDTANEWDFYPLPWSERTAQAVIFGFDGGFYPVRTTVTNHLRRLEQDSSLPASPISRHPHPGYDINSADEYKQTPLETYEIGHPSYQRHRELRHDFARGMRTAQICVFDSSLERKLIRKYAQALLSGCVIASDLPTEHEEAMMGLVIRLEPTWDIERIEAEINKYLAQPEVLHQMALDGFAYARRHLTTTAKISDMLRLVEAHRSGVRGYDHAHSFSSRCRSYSGHAPPPPWCDNQEGHRGLEDRLDPL